MLSYAILFGSSYFIVKNYFLAVNIDKMNDTIFLFVLFFFNNSFYKKFQERSTLSLMAYKLKFSWITGAYHLPN